MEENVVVEKREELSLSLLAALCVGDCLGEAGEKRDGGLSWGKVLCGKCGIPPVILRDVLV